MYDNFTLRRTSGGDIIGYHWPVSEPSKVVCIVHGIGEYGGRYDRVASYFNEAGFAVLSMDLRGHGASMGPKGHCGPREAVLDDVSALLTYAQMTYPGIPIILYGHSMGGNISLEYRARGGLNDLPSAYIITGPWIRLVHPIPEAAYLAVRTLARFWPRFTVGSTVDETALGNPETVSGYLEDPMVHNRISARCAVDGFETGRKLEEGSLKDEGRAAGIPLLLMHGGADRICDIDGTRKVADRLRRQGNPLEYIEWPGLFHEIHNGGEESDGREVIEKMVDYIGSIPDGAKGRDDDQAGN